MFQTFDTQASPAQGPARLAALRAALGASGLAGFIIPRADLHQGEYVAARDERLQWLTGFTGSAGFAVVLPAVAGVFIDGRYRTQVKAQVDVVSDGEMSKISYATYIRHRLSGFEIGEMPRAVPRDLDDFPEFKERLAKLTVFLSHGEQDNTLPVHWAHRSDALLSQLGVAHSLKLYPTDHGISAEMQADFVAWLAS